MGRIEHRHDRTWHLSPSCFFWNVKTDRPTFVRAHWSRLSPVDLDIRRWGGRVGWAGKRLGGKSPKWRQVPNDVLQVNRILLWFCFFGCFVSLKKQRQAGFEEAHSDGFCTPWTDLRCLVSWGTGWNGVAALVRRKLSEFFWVPDVGFPGFYLAQYSPPSHGSIVCWCILLGKSWLDWAGSFGTLLRS